MNKQLLTFTHCIKPCSQALFLFIFIYMSTRLMYLFNKRLTLAIYLSNTFNASIKNALLYPINRLAVFNIIQCTFPNFIIRNQVLTFRKLVDDTIKKHSLLTCCFTSKRCAFPRHFQNSMIRYTQIHKCLVNFIFYG